MNNKLVMSVSVTISIVVIIFLTIYWKPIESKFYYNLYPVKDISKFPKDILERETIVIKKETKDVDVDVDEKDSKKPSITKLGSFTDDEIMKEFGSTPRDPLKKYKIHKSIAKNGHSIPETKTESSFLYYFPESNDFTWSVENNWLLRDLSNDKYYVPEGLVKFDKDVVFEWTELKNVDSEKEIEIIIIS